MTDAPATPTRFERIMFVSIVPALVLPAIAAVTAIIGTSNLPSDGELDGPIAGLVVAVYMFVLLGSMTLNGWLLLRHPQSYLIRALPRRVAIVLAVLYGLIIVWIGLLAAGIVGVIGMAIGLALAAISIFVCGLAVARWSRHTGAQPIGEQPLPRWARFVGIGYLVLAGVSILFLLVSPVLGSGWSDIGGILGGPAVWIVLLFGLPWSHPLYFLGVILVFNLGSGMGDLIYFVTPALMVLSVVVNMALVASVISSPQQRAAITNWFFRLKPTKKAPPLPPAPLPKFPTNS
jgi:MFS family permease